jgi:hypothetical protein
VQRPALVILIALVASHWAKLEHTLSLPFTVLLGGQEPSAFEAYHELFELNLRQKMFTAVARKKNLPLDLISEAKCIYDDARKIAPARHTVVHGIWATIADRPDSLLLCKPDEINRKVDDFSREMNDKLDALAQGEAAMPWSFDLTLDDYTEYKHADFQDILNRIMALDGRADKLWTKIATFAISELQARRARPTRRQ